jgi:DNA-directed RNA polymerase subunit RPC12/RpoP
MDGGFRFWQTMGYTGAGAAMSLEICCTCGWRCQASEYYLGDRVACPECGAKILVHGRSGIPYGYAPYPTWQKRVPVTLPQPRPLAAVPTTDPHAGAAFWLGTFALVAALSGFGVVLGLILAAFSIRYVAQSARWNRRNNVRGPGRACAGLVLSIMAIMCAVSFFGSLVVHDDFPCRMKRPSTCIEQPPVQGPASNLRDLSEQLQRIEAEQRERERARRQQDFRYPVELVPPVEERTKEPAKQDAGYRYK